MLDEQTQLIFVDEFSEETVPQEIAKRVLQSGFFVTSDKHKKGRHFTNAANFYLTAQHKPDWGAENKGVYERIKDFQMSPLATIDRDVANWFKRNAINCVVWAGYMVKRHINQLQPMELYFMRPEVNQKDEVKRQVFSFSFN